MNLPNLLTLSRLILAAVFAVLIFSEGLLAKVLALAVFALACFTDWFDGRYARKHRQITALGQIMDPIADKVLVFSAFLSFVALRILPGWMVLVMLTREILVTLLRFVLSAKGAAVPAEKAGKYKTVLQSASIIVILILLVVSETSNWDADRGEAILGFIQTGMIFVVAFTLWSGFSYAANNWKKL